ncbi:hypothetical protein [Ruegeria arenilitoris]|uniref:hypothetical protein n=1 Tax=Ruegeria arenilitoris TaxID=1173585 RepID=UPI00147FCB34|nr:hypothetical protein [Ruegeria arenilitoris]
MDDVGSVITSQVDLLWSVALAMLVSESYLIARFLTGRKETLGLIAKLALGGSIIGHFLSMVFGYLTYGSVVEMVRVSDSGGEALQYYRDAAFSGVVQCGAFAVALLLFLAVFFLNSKVIGSALSD